MPWDVGLIHVPFYTKKYQASIYIFRVKHKDKCMFCFLPAVQQLALLTSVLVFGDPDLDILPPLLLDV